jgi:ATPase subunit of ABC transporter with duplicated ATPase domains
MTVRRLAKGFGDRILFRNLNLTLNMGARMAIVGQNGSGKTTLFRMLAGEEPIDSGEIGWAPAAMVATLSQGRNVLDMEQTAIQSLHPANSEESNFARAALARLGLRGVMAERRVGDLSVGERTKVEIVGMLVQGANVLMLDEPTNHLDLDSVEALESALMDFPGAIIFASHDREFVSRLATEVIELPIG